MKVLVIADNQEVVQDLSFCLRLRWQDAIVVYTDDGLKGMELLETGAPDLVIADLSLKSIDSLDLIRQIRESSEVPLIMIADQKNAMHGAKALEEGADDILTKPLEPVIFLVRLMALLRRTGHTGFKQDHGIFVKDSLVINFATHEVFISGKPVEFTPTEFDLLYHLVKNEGRILTHDTLLQKVWGEEYIGSSSLLRDCIYRVRKKLQCDSQRPPMILTRRGTGYRFAMPA